MTGIADFYNYFRDYDPSIARYVQSDPIGLAGGINTYAYVAGDPLRSSDAKGLNPSGKPDFWWRPCNPDQKAECAASCKAQGKEYDYCAERWVTYPGLNGPITRPTGAPISCSCKDPQGQPALSCDRNCQNTWKAIRDVVTGVIVVTLVCIFAF